MAFTCNSNSRENYLDDGASLQLKKGASLLAVGVKNVEGNFTINQAVKIVNTNDKEVAKGLVSISSDKLRSILNNKENNNSSIIVVHRDVLALLEKLKLKMLLSDLVDLIKKGNSNFISANIFEDLNIDDAASLDAAVKHQISF